MKRSEFIHGVTTWYELLDVCYENSLSSCEEIISEDSRNEYIDESLVDLARDNSWRDLMSILNSYDEDSGYDYYKYDETYCVWRPLDDDDFEDYKQYVLDEMDGNDYWDPEDDEEEVEDFEEEPAPTSPWVSQPESERGGYYRFSEEDDDLDFSDEEDCSIDDMLSSGAGCIRELSAVVKKQVCEEDDDLFAFPDTDIIF